MPRRPWSASRTGFADTTRRRIEIRLLFLGWSHARLCEEVGAVERGPPMAPALFRAYMLGKRAWRRERPDDMPQPIDRVAAALAVPTAALEPGGPWEPLVGRDETYIGALTAADTSTPPAR